MADGQTIAVGGFGLCGIPEALILALRDSGVKNLTAISNNAGVDDFGLGQLLTTRQIKKMISSYVGENKEFAPVPGRMNSNSNSRRKARWLKNCAAWHGAGIPAFFTKTGVGTIVADGKEVREFDGEQYVMERSLVADVSLVKAYMADRAGNLVYRKTARNFNPNVAMAKQDHHRGSGKTGRSRRDRSGPSAHAEHFRAPYRRQRKAGKAHRTAHRARQLRTIGEEHGMDS
ncbi:3-oxoacid CoA-transferase subunit A [Massilia sp. H-1]|nr:3-oxoacid CoA-transferase subunit A [Massilia sp. H-1]